MRLEAVVAMARNRVIGRDGGLPWHLPEDLRHFRARTIGKPVLMGRLTWESIGRALPQRLNIVVSARADYALPEGVLLAKDIDQGLALAARVGAEVCMVIGGAGIYRQTLARTARIHLTEIDIEPEGDTFLPELDPAEWRETAREEGPTDSPSGLRFRFITLDRV
jgi:dihydrofolate reductase